VRGVIGRKEKRGFACRELNTILGGGWGGEPRTSVNLVSDLAAAMQAPPNPPGGCIRYCIIIEAVPLDRAVCASHGIPRGGDRRAPM
jgi:hypothetical protein